MARIKSAWELALEKTKDIQADTEKIAHDEKVQAGRKLAANFLSDYQQSPKDLAAELDKIPAKDKDTTLEGVLAVILDNISLPMTKDYQQPYQRVRQLASVLGNPGLDQGLEQIGQFFDQYLQQQDDITDQVKQQYAPRLEQKQAQLCQQYGQDITLQPEQDPDFLKMLDATLKKLDAQYTGALTRFKSQLKALFPFCPQ